MKINIGPYTRWIGPYQIAEKLLFWMDRHEDPRVHKFGEFLAHGFYKKKPCADGKDYFDDERPYTWLYKLCSWIESKKKRKVKIQIDPWDTWNMDNTLALIILPMLKQMRDKKHGSPFTDDKDVPDNLKSTAAPPKKNDWDTDDNHCARWDWILDEMVWAFEQIVTDEEPDFWTIEPQGMHSVKEEGTNLSRIEWDVEGEMDWTAAKAYKDRIANGTRLFGKYYQALWD
jgi:hypothetical protein